MKLFNEMLDPTTIRLSHTERVVLASIYGSPTTQMGYESTFGAENVVFARNSLMKFGLIKIQSGNVQITNMGQQALLANNIIDDVGELTDNGKELQDQLDDIKRTYNESLQPYKLIKSFDL